MTFIYVTIDEDFVDSKGRVLYTTHEDYYTEDKTWDLRRAMDLLEKAGFKRADECLRC